MRWIKFLLIPLALLGVYYFFYIKKTVKKMKLSAKGRDYLKVLEGYREQPYSDIAGIKTVGWGHTGKDIALKSSLAQNKVYFENDVARFEKIVNTALMVEVSQDFFDSLVFHAFNIGHASENLYLLINKKASYENICNYWYAHYVTAKGSKNPVLRSRRLKEINYFNPNFKP